MRILPAVLAYLTVLFASGQGGIRLIIWNYEPVLVSSDAFVDGQHLGVGYDQDLNHRLSFGIQFRMNTGVSRGWVANYQSAFHFNDNSSGSFYFGPNIGVRSIPGPDAKVLVPIGARIGVRGGLERFYADLHAGVQYNIGGGQPLYIDRGGVVDLRTGSFCFGLDLGWGWEPSRRR